MSNPSIWLYSAKPYAALLRARLSILFQYRGAAMAGFFTQIFWGLIKVMILTAFYDQSTGTQPITLVQAATFIWIGQSLLGLLPWNLDKEIEAQVKNGNVAYDLVRPLDPYWHWYARALALRIVPTTLRSVPMFIAAFLLFGLEAPASGASLAAFGCSVACSALLSAAITTLVVITLFWTLSGEGIQRLLPQFVVMLSGMVVPLPLYPEWMQPFLEIQPFRCIMDIPCRLYTGVIPAADALYYLGLQLAWLAVIIGCGRHLIKRAINQLVIQGG